MVGTKSKLTIPKSSTVQLKRMKDKKTHKELKKLRKDVKELQAMLAFFMRETLSGSQQPSGPPIGFK